MTERQAFLNARLVEITAFEATSEADVDRLMDEAERAADILYGPVTPPNGPVRIGGSYCMPIYALDLPGMSEGLLCQCVQLPSMVIVTGVHPDARTAGPGGCGRYAADQETGGYCSSCAAGWHAPCSRPRFTPGSCEVCGWHGTSHRVAEHVR